MSGLKQSFKNSICFVAINNPEAGQSFGPCEAEELVKLLKSKELKASKGLIWTTRDNGIFCSGGNLKHYKKQTQRLQGIKTNRAITQALNLLAEVPIPTVAAVNGDAFGGGVELLGCFDFIYSTPKPFFGLWQRRIGLTFGWGGGARLLKRMTHQKTVQFSLLAQSFSAYEAVQIGLVDEIVPSTLIIEKSVAYVQKQNARPLIPFKAIKQWSAVKERSIFEKLWFNKDHKSVLNKF